MGQEGASMATLRHTVKGGILNYHGNYQEVLTHNQEDAHIYVAEETALDITIG